MAEGGEASLSPECQYNRMSYDLSYSCGTFKMLVSCRGHVSATATVPKPESQLGLMSTEACMLMVYMEVMAFSLITLLMACHFDRSTLHTVESVIL